MKPEEENMIANLNGHFHGEWMYVSQVSDVRC